VEGLILIKEYLENIGISMSRAYNETIKPVPVPAR
jgi:hypothetical protein